ncbi:MAM and LDL-receptor class A domain-containing protein 1-like [Acipenser ruthenus]|uniref:MAM and LDL-receptor class A domain-containing protein 1-like n=1 Tax=Acipenser ruthenus TaxID=7906 RepID=UPI0027415994|nr:MAM and LDL-receptor class A domain-containing protein 1-like [Acipenser ruthenus]
MRVSNGLMCCFVQLLWLVTVSVFGAHIEHIDLGSSRAAVVSRATNKSYVDFHISGDGKNTDSHVLVEKLLKKSQRDVVQLGTSPSAATPVSAAAKETTGPASSIPVSASSQAGLSTGTSTGHDQTTLQSNEVTQSLPPTPSPRPASLFCDFELDLCGWENCRSGDFNWLLRRERPAEFETQTLPDGHASCRNFAGQYLYMEAAFPRESGQTAVLISPVFKGPKCLSFWYSLIGDGVEAVTVYVAYVSSPDSWHKLWSASGAMPRKWSFQQLDLFVGPDEEFQILLEGTISNNYCGDAAIDDLLVSENRCMSFKRLHKHRRRELPATPAPEGSPSVSTAPVLPPPEVLETLFCDFEKGLCGWSQCTSDDFDWELHQERLPPLLSATQPDSQGKCRNFEGQYLYMEAAFPWESGQTAVLISPVFKGPKCLSFWYSLFGDGVGSLSVYMQYVSTAGTWHKLWSVGGNKSRKWHLADLELFVDPNEMFQMILEGTIGNNPCGGVAVDDLFVTGHHCGKEQHAPCWKD